MRFNARIRQKNYYTDFLLKLSPAYSYTTNQLNDPYTFTAGVFAAYKQFQK